MVYFHNFFTIHSRYFFYCLDSYYIIVKYWLVWFSALVILTLIFYKDRKKIYGKFKGSGKRRSEWIKDHPILTTVIWITIGYTIIILFLLLYVYLRGIFWFEVDNAKFTETFINWKILSSLFKMSALMKKTNSYIKVWCM